MQVTPTVEIWAEVDALHQLLVKRADTLIGCTDGSADQDELEAIGEAIEAYESVRWPQGKIDGGKG
jgi:hypothetical protein